MTNFVLQHRVYRKLASNNSTFLEKKPIKLANCSCAEIKVWLNKLYCILFVRVGQF